MNALTEILSHPFVHKLGWTLVHLLWQGAAVAVLLCIVLRLLGKCSANLRYVVACSALAVVVVLPVVTICLVPALPSYALLEAESASLQAPMGEAMRIVPVNLESVESVESFGAVGLKQRAVNLLEPALPYIVACWVLGVFALSLWHLGGWTHLQCLRRRLTKQADDTLLAKLSTLAEELRVTRPVRLVESALVQIPTVVGWVRPVILLPATALTGLTGDQVEALLAHELAHIRRGDYLINMLQTVVEILGFYHPAVWWISNEIRLERENCCDDLAVATCGDKMHYATALAEMERIRSTQGELAMAANGGNLLMRIRRLIGKSPAPKQRFNWAAALITAMVIAALAIPTTLALSRSRAVEDTAEADTVETVELDEARRYQRPLPPASVTGETGEKAQILFEIKYFQLPADSKLIKEAGKDGTFVRTDKAFAEKLVELSKKSKEAKILTAPRVTVIEGEDAVITTSNEMPYIAGYTEQPDGEPKPIIRYAHRGFNARVKGDLVGDGAILVRLTFVQTVPTLTTHKVAKGREIQIPIIRTTECATAVTVEDNGVVIIGGLGDLQNADKADQSFIVQMVSRIVRKGDTDSLTGPLRIADSSEEVSFTVAPQVITSVRVDTEGISAFADSGNGAAKAVEELIAMLKGQRSLSFELLDSKMAVAGQLDDLRKIVSEQSVEIDSVLSDGDQALITTKSLKDDRGHDGQLVFHLTREKAKWTIDDIDFEDPQGLKDEMKRFDEEMRKSREVPILTTKPLLGAMFEATSGPGVLDTVNNLVNLSKSEIHGGVDPKTKKQADELARILGDRELEVANARVLGQYAIVISKPMEAEGETGQLVFKLTKAGNKWVIDDVDFESPGGVRDEMARFNDMPLKAEPVSTGIGEGVEATASTTPKTGGASEKAVTRIYALQHAKAADIASSLGNFALGSAHSIVPDVTSNRLVVLANESQHQRIESLIAQLDVAAPGEAEKTPLQVRVFVLQYADASRLAEVLKSLLTKEQEEVRIVPDSSKSNRLIVLAREDDFEQITKLIELLDVPQAGSGAPAVETVTQVVQLEYADSQQVVTILTNLSVLGRNSRIVSDARLNQLIIEAPEADLEQIMNLIEQIDKPVDEKAAKRQSSSKDKQLAVLIDQREELAEKMQSLREFISHEQRKSGITESAKQQDLMLQRTSSLLAELAKTESLRMRLEAQLSLLDKGTDQSVSPQERLKMRQEYVNSDATVKALAEKIAEVEMDLLLASQEKGGDHPEIKRNVNLLEALKVRLGEAKDEVGVAFERLIAVEGDKARLQNIVKAKAEIEQNMAYEEKLRKRLAEENEETNDMAQKQLRIQGIRDDLDAIKAMYEEANRRIMDLRMQPQELPTLYDIGESGTE